MTDCLQHYDLIDLVERVICIYEQKTPILHSQFFVPNSFSPVDRAVDYRLKSGTHPFILTQNCSPRYCDIYQNIFKNTSSGFSDTDWMHSRLFVKRDQAECHKFKIGHPGRANIG